MALNAVRLSLPLSHSFRSFTCKGQHIITPFPFSRFVSPARLLSWIMLHSNPCFSLVRFVARKMSRKAYSFAWWCVVPVELVCISIPGRHLHSLPVFSSLTVISPSNRTHNVCQHTMRQESSRRQGCRWRCQCSHRGGCPHQACHSRWVRLHLKHLHREALIGEWRTRVGWRRHQNFLDYRWHPRFWRPDW